MENMIVTVDVLKNADELLALENAFLKAVGEDAMPPENVQRLKQAMAEGKIIFFAARIHGKPVGMCSVSPSFSTFACRNCGVFDDFYVAPEHRGQGIARKLANAAQLWCRQQGYASLMVGCAAADVAMYQSLGFDTELGVMLASNL